VFHGAEKQHVNRPTWGSSYTFRFSPPLEGEDAEVDVVLLFDRRESIGGTLPASTELATVVHISRSGEVSIGE